MPIVAESPPLIYGGPATPTPAPTKTPAPAKTPKPPKVSVPGAFVAVHERFINRVDEQSACFKREDLSDFVDQDFLDHVSVAIKDKYITQEKDIYCSMKGVQILTKALKRLGEE